MLFDYDDSNAKSILNYAKKLEGKTFRELLNTFNLSPIKSYEQFQSLKASHPNFISEHSTGTESYSINPKAKGGVGDLIEKCYFGYNPNGIQGADFPKAGIELKQTCMDLTKQGKLVAGERLSITNINFTKEVEDDFFKSHVWDKIRLILLIHYLRDKSIDRLDNQIKFINLFTPPEEDLKIIIEDYHKINQKIKSGLAHEISEGDTLYLGACTKGQTAEKSMQEQRYNPSVKAKSRNYCFKRGYMDYVLQNYVLKNKVPCESIFKNNNIDDNTSFEKFIVNQINQYTGKSDIELCNLFKRPYNKSKSQWSDLAYRMLGIKSNKAEEFVKANILVKTIRIEEDGTMNEHMSLPIFKFKDLVKETWDESTLHEYFNEHKFLFVVYRAKKGIYYLEGAKLWNMPYSDLEETVKKEWTTVKELIATGINFTVKGKKVNNNLPKPSDTQIIHVRPHANKAAYLLHSGYKSGNIEKNANELPNGEWMTTQSFWLNNTYILSQLKNLK